MQVSYLLLCDAPDSGIQSSYFTLSMQKQASQHCGEGKRLEISAKRSNKKQDGSHGDSRHRVTFRRPCAEHPIPHCACKNSMQYHDWVAGWNLRSCLMICKLVN